MHAAVLQEIDRLRGMTLTQLRERYQEVYGEPCRSRHKVHVFRRLAWRLQALAEGGLSERAQRRALEIASDVDLKNQVPTSFVRSLRSVPTSSSRRKRDPRLPVPGSVLSRVYQNQTILVKVLPNGFEYGSRQYGSLSAIATEITGTRWNGLAFFGLTSRRGNRAEAQP
jgi:hypothetical protein